MKDCGVHQIYVPGRDRPIEERKLFQCVHCGNWFEIVKKDSDQARVLILAGMSLEDVLNELHRGWCARCDGPYCGPCCDPDRMLVHEHFMQRIERIEQAAARGQSNLWSPALHHFT